jgi:hypothetical protein
MATKTLDKDQILEEIEASLHAGEVAGKVKG